MATYIQPLFTKKKHHLKMGDNKAIRNIRIPGTELIELIPAQIEDAYHYLEIVMQMRHAYYDLPEIMTLSRYRYLLSRYEDVYNLKSLCVLDPFADVTCDLQRQAMKYLDKDVFENLHNTMVLCVSGTASEILALPRTGESKIVFFTDRHITLPTAYGCLTITFRIFNPTSVSTEAVREKYLRMIATNNVSLSARSALLLQDVKFPLGVIPGVGSFDALVALACSAPTLDREACSQFDPL